MYSALESFLKEEILLVRRTNEEVFCVDVMRASMRRCSPKKRHRLTDRFVSPVLSYLEQDCIITLYDLKQRLLKFFSPWRSTAAAIDALIDALEYGCIDSRIYFCAPEKEGERPIGNLIGLWYEAMPKSQRLPIETMYGKHDFEKWIIGTRPGMTSRNTPYLSQFLFVLRECRKELFSC